MPAIVYPVELPAPQELSALVVDTRLQSDPSEKGPVEFRTIEQDERQRQQLVFTYTPEETAIFREWWTTALVYGGAWFSAPESWPDMHGLVVRVRRFITAPQFIALGADIWRVSITAECRGETLLPNEPEPDTGGEGWDTVNFVGPWNFSENNFRAQTNGTEGAANIVSVVTQSEGLRYAELVFNEFSYPAPVDGNAGGITAFLSGGENLVYDFGAGIDTSTGVFVNGNFSQSFIETLEIGDVIMLAIDLNPEDSKIWFGRNGEWFGGLSPEEEGSLSFGFERVGESLSMHIGATAASGFSFDVTLRIASGQFEYSPPPGFSPWDS